MRVYPVQISPEVARSPAGVGGRMVGYTRSTGNGLQLVSPMGTDVPAWEEPPGPSGMSIVLEQAAAAIPQAPGFDLGPLWNFLDNGAVNLFGPLSPVQPVEMFPIGGLGGIGPRGAIGRPNAPGVPGRAGVEGIMGGMVPHTLDSDVHWDVDPMVEEAGDILWNDTGVVWKRLDNPTGAAEVSFLRSTSTTLSWEVFPMVHVAGTFTMTLGDNAGADSLIVEDSDNATVFSVDSNGVVNSVSDFTLAASSIVGKSLLSADDTTMNWLEDKIASGTTVVGTSLGVTMTTTGGPGNEVRKGTVSVAELLTEIGNYTKIEKILDEQYNITGNDSGFIYTSSLYGRVIWYSITYLEGSVAEGDDGMGPGSSGSPHWKVAAFGVFHTGETGDGDNYFLYDMVMGGGTVSVYLFDDNGGADDGKLVLNTASFAGADEVQVRIMMWAFPVSNDASNTDWPVP